MTVPAKLAIVEADALGMMVPVVYRDSGGRVSGGAMVWDELARGAEDDNKRDRDRWIGVWIGILAVILAICGMGGSNATKDATIKNIEASNTWAFFQAKNMRRHVLRLQADDLDLQLVTNPAMPEAGKAAVQARIADYRKQIELLTSEKTLDKPVKEGLDELFERGKGLERERDVAMAKDPYFDYAQALLQIAIVLASIAIISGGSWLLIFSFVLGGLGALTTINGFLLLFQIPWIG